MPDGFAFKFVVEGHEMTPLALAFRGRLQEVIDANLADVSRAYPKAMDKGVTQPGKRRLRATIEASGFYRAGSLAKTWRGSTYPRSAPTLEPAAVFKSRAALIVNAFEDGVTITVQNAKFLAIPEGPAKAIIHRLNQASNRSREGGKFAKEDDPTARVAAALGVELVPLIDKRNDRGVLVAASGARLTRGGRFAKSQIGRPTPLFALVRHATLKRRAMGREVLKELDAGFVANFAAALAAELPEGNR